MNSIAVTVYRVTLNDAGWEVIDEVVPLNSNSVEIDFREFDKLESREFAFEMTEIPFDSPGTYRFSVWAVDYADEWDSQMLPGETTELIVLEIGG